MWFLIIIASLISGLVDFFLGSAVYSFYSYTGFLLIFFAMYKSAFKIALIIAIAYGFFADLISPIAPFGIFLAVNFAAYLALKSSMSIFINTSEKMLIVFVFFGSIFYGAILGIAQYASISLLTEFSTSLSSFISFWLILIPSIITTAFLLAGIILYRFISLVFGKWFFIK